MPGYALTGMAAMGRPVHRRWAPPGGELVIDFSILPQLDHVPSSASVSFVSAPDKTVWVEIRRDAVRPFLLALPDGRYVKGHMIQVQPVYLDGVANMAIFADVRYRQSPGEESHFEGVMAACPMRDGAAHPTPPLPGPPPPEPADE